MKPNLSGIVTALLAVLVPLVFGAPGAHAEDACPLGTKLFRVGAAVQEEFETFDLKVEAPAYKCVKDEKLDSGGEKSRGGPSGQSRRHGGSTPPPIPDFIDYLQLAENDWTYDCAGGSCTAARNTCVTVPNYSVDGYDVVATPRSERQSQADDAVTYESFTRDTRTNRDTFNGYTCQSPGTPVPSGGGPVAAGGGAAPEQVVIIVTQAEFAELPVEPAVASAGPEAGWLPVGMVNVLYAESEIQTLETELLGTSVAVRAIPTSYHWDLGDGSTITTSKSGKPFPSEEVSATYAHEGWYDITLTTTFAGQFSVDGGEWQDIDGTIEVESEPIPLYSKSLESRLVNGDVPVDEDEDPWVPERTPDTEGPKADDATDRKI